MSYTVHLFAHKGNEFATQLRESPTNVVSAVEKWCQRHDIAVNEAEMECVRKIVSGQLPPACGPEYFDGLCWIGNALMERVSLPELTDVRRFSTIQQYGIVPGLTKSASPYPLPTSMETPPVAGYLPWAEMKAFEFLTRTKGEAEHMGKLQDEVDAIFQQLGKQLVGKTISPPSRSDVSQEQVEFVRDEFRSIMDSLIEDQLDLLTVIT